jgi:hypothetical protein
VVNDKVESSSYKITKPEDLVDFIEKIEQNTKKLIRNSSTLRKKFEEQKV